VNQNSKIFVAGHRGLVGSALMRKLGARGYTNVVIAARSDLDLSDARATDAFFAAEQPAIVFLAAAMVGGIHANNSLPADFIGRNLAIQSSVIHAAYRHGVQRLLFLGSSCIYPKHAPQPLREDALHGGPLEPTNRPYAMAKLAGIEMCWAYNRQHGTRYLAVMPTNLYGPGDNYHPENSHVIPALIRRFHEAKLAQADEVVIWGSGTPRREFLYSDDLADACLHIAALADDEYDGLLWPAGDAVSSSDRNLAPLVNIGIGSELSIAALAQLVRKVVGFEGDVVFDPSRPDGTPRKLLDVSRLHRTGWRATTTLTGGLGMAYEDFLARPEGRTPFLASVSGALG